MYPFIQLPSGRVVSMDSDAAYAYRMGMGYPVKCNCGRIYDLHKVEVVGRFIDATEWRTPCCKRIVNDGMFNKPYERLEL